VIRTTFDGGGSMLGIHEAYYDAQGRVWAVTKDPKRPIIVESSEENVETLKEYLGMMLKAFDRPILNLEDIPEEGADSPNWTIDLDEDDEISPDDTIFDDPNATIVDEDA
jgi:hypothetical protein